MEKLPPISKKASAGGDEPAAALPSTGAERQNPSKSSKKSSPKKPSIAEPSSAAPSPAATGAGEKAKTKKSGAKEPPSMFPSRAVIDYHDVIRNVDADDIRNGEFDSTMLYFNPTQARGECSMTIGFRCTAKIVVGDTITIRLGGFKGDAVGRAFTLESRPNEEFEKHLADMPEKARSKQLPLEHRFQAYYTGDNPPTKSIPAQSIILRCRHAIEENTKVVLGVPEAAHICLPEKLAENSAKIKIDGIIKHASGGKIPRASFQLTGEVKKRPIEADIAELEELIGFYAGHVKPRRKSAKEGSTAANGEEEDEDGAHEGGDHDEEHYEDDFDDDHDADDHPAVDMTIAEEITLPEADQIAIHAAHRRQHRMGLRWVVETRAFHSYEETCQPICKTLVTAYDKLKRSGDEFFLHRELAKNYGVKLSQIIVLEDALYALHGVYYPRHTRAAVMVMRLYTMETHDVVNLLSVAKPPCMYREIQSAVRSRQMPLLEKWANTMLALSTCPMNLREFLVGRGEDRTDLTAPTLYVGLRDLPADELMRISNLKAGDLFMTTNFLSCVRETDEEISYPDTGVLLEIRGVLNAVEIGDVSYYPNDAEWLLPMFSSFHVASITHQPEKNHLIVITLDFRGSFGGLTDNRLPQSANEDRTNFKMAVSVVGGGGVHLALQKVSKTTSLTAKCIYAHLRLLQVKAKHPQYLVRAKYQAQFAHATCASKAAETIEDGYVKWYCKGLSAPPPAATGDKGNSNGNAGIVVNDGPKNWELLPARYSTLAELCFLKRTRNAMVMSEEGPPKGPDAPPSVFTIDFIKGTIDYGKGLMSVKREAGRYCVPPFPLPDDPFYVENQ